MASQPAPPKFFANDFTTLRQVSDQDAKAELIKCLEKLVNSYPPLDVWPAGEIGVGGLYCGPTGIAYLFMTIAKERPELTIGGKSCHAWAGEYLEGQRPSEEPTPPNCAVINETTCHTAVCAAYHQSDDYVKQLISFVSKLTDTTVEWEGSAKVRNYEYCYGLAGLLYLLRLTKTWYPVSSEQIDIASRAVIDFILAQGPPWIFHERFSMLGPGHGDVGIIFQIIRSDPSFAANASIRKVLEHILDQQLEDGNWPCGSTEAAVSSEDLRLKAARRLVQWCHGAPGMVQCLVQLRPHFPDLVGRIDSAVEKGRAFTWKEGLLAKEPNLCHGITGNAFAFPPGPKRDHFLSFTTEKEVEEGLAKGEFEKCDYGIGHALGFGAPGRAVGWLWRDRDVEKEGKGCYLCFDEL